MQLQIYDGIFDSGIHWLFSISTLKQEGLLIYILYFVVFIFTHSNKQEI